MLTLAEAARASTVSIATLRRHRAELEAHGAVVSETGWEIPYAALIALGYAPRSTPPTATPDTPVRGRTSQRASSHASPSDTPPDSPADSPDAGQVAALREQVREMEHQLVLARMERDAERAMAQERGQTIDTLKLALRALEQAPRPAVEPPAAPVPTPPVAQPEPTPAEREQQPRSGWRRLLGR